MGILRKRFLPISVIGFEGRLERSERHKAGCISAQTYWAAPGCIQETMYRRKGLVSGLEQNGTVTYEGKQFNPEGENMATTDRRTDAGNRKKPPLMLTPQAITKVREIMATQDPLPAGLRIGVVGGGCSGFQYSMAFENQAA